MYDKIFMDAGVIRQYSQRFDDMGDSLEEINQTLDSIIVALSETAFMGKIGGKSVKIFINDLKPTIDYLTTKYREMSKDLDESARDYENRDLELAQQFK